MLSKRDRQQNVIEARAKMPMEAKIVQRFSSGPYFNELLTVQEAIWAAKGLENALRDAYVEENGAKSAKLAQERCIVHIAYMTPDLTMLHTKRYVAGKESDILAALTSNCCTMVGLVFAILDDKGEAYMNVKAFLGTKRVVAALRQRMEDGSIGVH